MLKNFYPNGYAKSVFDVDFQKLYDMGYKAIIFDVDNTLVHHGDSSNDDVDNLFRDIHKIGLKTLLLSNNDSARLERFCKNINTLYIPDAQKPNIDGYIKALNMLNVKNTEAIYIGDQIFIDIYGANKSKIDSILVHFIQIDVNEKIGIKRHIEKIILYFYKFNKKQQKLNNVINGVTYE